MNLAAMQGMLRREEGVRLKPYRDTVGKLTIGVGRNLDDVGISDAECMVLLANDLARTSAGLDASLPWWRQLDEVRQEVVLDMAFNMGLATLMEFHSTLAATKAGRFGEAASGMLASRWAKQVHGRADALAAMMRSGRSA